MSKLKYIEIETPIYPIILCVSVDQNDSELRKSLRDHGDVDELIDEFNGYQTARTVSCINGVSIVRMRQLTRSPEDIALLSHELFHVVFYHLTDIGVVISNDSEETFAYLLQFYTEQVLEAFKLIK